MKDVISEAASKLTECVEECYGMLATALPEEMVISSMGGAMMYALLKAHDDRKASE